MLGLLVISVLAQASAEPIPLPMTPEPAAVDAGTPSPAEPQKKAEPVATPSGPSGVVLRGGGEAGFTSWPEGNPQDLLFFVRPLLSFEVSDWLDLEAGATFNLIVLDDAPDNRAQAYGRILRRQDWDEPSDFGQIIRQLRLGRPDQRVWLRAGPVRLKTLGPGHVVNRYSNQDNPNYHPASASAGAVLGAFRTELFASDIFGARLFSGLIGLELGRLFSGNARWLDRFPLTVEVAHDFGLAGGTTPSLSIAHADFGAMLWRGDTVRFQLLAGAGGRFGSRVAGGLLAGLTFEADFPGFQLGAKVEARKQGGGFRQGMFGPQYELSRFAGAGFSGVPLADQLLPDSGSVYGELRAGTRGALVAEAAVEWFFWGRADLDVSLQAELFQSRVVTAMRFTAVALGVFPRYAVSAEARMRLLDSFYLLAAGGTAFFVRSDGALDRGVFVTAGCGLDFSLGEGR